MKIYRIVVTFFVLMGMIFSAAIKAEPAIHTVEGKFKAVFPVSPQFVGSLGSGKYSSRGFIAMDEVNIIVYRAAYGTDQLRFKEEDIPLAIDNYIKGEALALGAEITHKSIGAIGEYNGAYYTLELTYKGFPARIYGAVIYYGEKFITWGVEDIPSLSKQDASKVFNAYSEYFKPM